MLSVTEDSLSLFYIVLNIISAIALLSSAFFGIQFGFSVGLMLYPVVEIVIALVALVVAMALASHRQRLGDRELNAIEKLLLVALIFGAASPVVIFIGVSAWLFGIVECAPLFLLVWQSVLKLKRVLALEAGIGSRLMSEFGFNILFAVALGVAAVAFAPNSNNNQHSYMPPAILFVVLALWYLASAYVLFKGMARKGAAVG